MRLKSYQLKGEERNSSKPFKGYNLYLDKNCFGVTTGN
jgi:hypothetical protein